MKLNNILVIMDPTIDQQPALARAIMLAKQSNAAIELLLVVYHSGLVSNWLSEDAQRQLAIENYLKSMQRWLDSYIAEVAHQQIPVTSEVRWHKPLYEEVLTKIDDCHPDMVIKSTHQHSLLNTLLFTPNDWQLLKSCPVPLLLAKAQAEQQYRHIMAAVDLQNDDIYGKKLDTVIMQTSASLAQSLGATTHVAHAFDPIGTEIWPNLGVDTFGMPSPLYDYQDYQQLQLQRHQRELDTLIADYSIDHDNVHLESGIAHYQLLDMVKQYHIDLLVIGMRSHSGFVGNTAAQLLDAVTCDILALNAG